MRVSIGLGLVAVVALFACSATTDDAGGPAASTRSPDDDGLSDDVDPTTSTDPTEPAPSASEPEDPSSRGAPRGAVLSGIAVTDVAVFQAVKVPVMTDGAAVGASARNAPVVARRPGILRVYVAPQAGWKTRDVTAELRLSTGSTELPVIRETKRIGGPSTDEDPASTFNLEVPAASLPPGVSYQVALTGEGGDASLTGDSDGRYPRDGSFEDLGAEVSGKVNVVIVPVEYDADGSGRLPDLGQAQLALYKKTMMAWYPASEIQITTRAPYPWKSRIANNGSGFQEILRAITQLRQQDGVAKDVYYYGLFTPGTSFTSYCGGGCVTGLSTIVDRNAPSMRASVGIGFSGAQSAETMAHEIGHAHGREHAPCGGAQGVDPKFPYKNASIGVWGYSIFDKTFIAPSKGHDMMGYCPNQWVSDYTYSALFERIAAVSVSNTTFAPPSGEMSAKRSFRIATDDGSGKLAWSGDIDLDDDLAGGSLHQATYLTDAGDAVRAADAHYFRFDHLPGGFLFVPAEKSVTWKAVAVAGFADRLAR